MSLHLREIHFFIIDSFCLYYVIHPFSTDTTVLYIYMLRPLTLLANNHLTSLNDVASILLFHNQQPCSGIINILTCLLSYRSKIVYFQNYQPFSLSLKGREFMVMTLLFLRFSTLIRYLPCTSSVCCEYDQICKHANIQSVLGYSDKPFKSAVKTKIDRSLYMMFTLSQATQPLGAC